MSGHVQRETCGHDGRTCASSKPHDFGLPHTHVLGNQASVIFARPHVPTKYGHTLAQIVGVHKHPYKRPYISTQLHVSPRIAHEILGAQLTAGLPRFGPPHLSTALHNSRPPSSTACYGHPRNFGQPSRYMGVHGKSWVLDSHTRPRSLWAPMKYCGPAHATCGQPSHGSFGCPCTYRGRPITASLGRPNMWPTSRILGHHNIADGAPRYCYGLPRYLLAVHGMLWATKRQPSWSTTMYCGHPREFMGSHV